MKYLNIFYKIKALIMKIIYSFIYKDKLVWNKNTKYNIHFRNRFKLIIEDTGKVEIGNGCFFNNDCSISCLGHIKIGENCIFGENVKLYDHNHVYKDKDKLIKEQGFKIGEIIIGNNVWIGSNVIILNNVTIGDNVIIGSNCLIYKPVESNTVVKNKVELVKENIY